MSNEGGGNRGDDRGNRGGGGRDRGDRGDRPDRGNRASGGGGGAERVERERDEGGGTAVKTEKADMPVVELSALKEMSVTELTKIAKQLDVPGASGWKPRRTTCRAA